MAKKLQTQDKPSSSRNRTSPQIWQRFDQFVSLAERWRGPKILLSLGALIIGLIMSAIYVADRLIGTKIHFVLGVLIFLIFVAFLVFVALLFVEIFRLAKRQQVSGQTQRRLVTIFVMMALVPTILVAVFSTVTLNFGLENWFSNRVKNVVDSSYDTAIAYADEHDKAIRAEGQIVYQKLTLAFQNSPTAAENPRPSLNLALETVSDSIKRGFIINGHGVIISRATGSYLYNYHQPNEEELARAIKGEKVIIKDLANNEFRYLRGFDQKPDYYLYITREVDGKILALLNQTESTAKFYRDSENSRQQMFIFYGLFYIAMAVAILLLAIWAALFFSARLTRPISQLVRTVERISEGDLNARVLEMNDNDEFSILSRSFNQMTSEVQNNQKALEKAGEASEVERQRFNNVLETVSSGLIGVGQNGKVNFINSYAIKLLGLKSAKKSYQISEIAPEFDEILQRLRAINETDVQEQIALLRKGTQETLFVRVSKSGDVEKPGNVIISFDVVSDLIQAQRMAAWGDVARRIAHEIKNPLTPIRLSAERLRRKYGPQIHDEPEKFEELTQIIVRQTEDLRRIVDEFSKFSRMPEAAKVNSDWIFALKSAMTLFETSDRDIVISYSGPNSVAGFFDPSLIGQVFNNLIKNGIESIAARCVREEGTIGKLIINAETNLHFLTISIIDNGLGFPAEKTRLFEPYVTLKETGTGLGLPIVKKILEDHDAKISLHDRDDREIGARVEIKLPITHEINFEEGIKQNG